MPSPPSPHSPLFPADPSADHSDQITSFLDELTRDTTLDEVGSAGEVRCPICGDALQVDHVWADSMAREVRVLARCMNPCGIGSIDVALRGKEGGALAVALSLASQDAGEVLVQKASGLRAWADNAAEVAEALPADDPRAIEEREREARYRRRAQELDEAGERLLRPCQS